MYKNLKISAKLLIGFLIVAIIAVAVGVVGVVSLKKADDQDTMLYEKMTVPLAYLSDARNAFQRERGNTKDIILTADKAKQADYAQRIKARREEVAANVKLVGETLLTDEGRKTHANLETALANYYSVIDKAIALAQQDRDLEAYAIVDKEGYEASQGAQEAMQKLVELKLKVAKETSDGNTVAANKAIILMVALAAAAFLLAMGIGLLISRSISKPINGLVETANTLSVGDIDVSVVADSKDEIGKLMEAFAKMIENTKNQAATAERIASGDLSIMVTERSDKDVMAQKMNLMIRNIRALTEDAAMLSQAAIDGKLSTRADARKHEGDFRKIVEGVNSTLDAVIAPVQEASNVLVEMSKGNLSVAVTGDYRGDHEVIKNALNGTIENLKRYVNEISAVLNEIADGNMVVGITADYKGDFFEIKDSLNKIVNNLNSVLGDINSAADQVNAGARQVSDSSQNLSQGSTEQANSIEEITASLTQVSAQTRQNAVSANQANELAISSQRSAIDGNAQMKEMLDAMEQINESSSSINRIIKVIDEIAFQTNILALNAAVEAARAGQHGKGFAVVAEEARNLAARSANAAKETTTMIEGSIKKVEIGTKIANETASALGSIVEGVSQAAELVGQIAVASNEQATAISQISSAIEQVSQVTQMNTATAEQSAAASQELSSQSMLLKDMIGRFSLKRMEISSNASHYHSEPAGRSSMKSRKPVKNISISLDDTEFGKY